MKKETVKLHIGKWVAVSGRGPTDGADPICAALAMIVSCDEKTAMVRYVTSNRIFPIPRDIIHEASLGVMKNSGKHVAFVKGDTDSLSGEPLLGYPLFGQQAMEAEALGKSLIRLDER